MRALILLVIACSLLLLALYASTYKAVRIDQEYCEGVTQPSADFMAAHSERLARLANHLKGARGLALVFALASISSLLLSLKNRNKMSANQPLQATADGTASSASRSTPPTGGA